MLLFLLGVIYIRDGYHSDLLTAGTTLRINIKKDSVFAVINSDYRCSGIATSGSYVRNILGSTGKHVAFFNDDGTIEISTSSSSEMLYYAVYDYGSRSCSSLDVYIGNGNFKIGGTEEKNVNSTIVDDIKLCLFYISKDEVNFEVNIDNSFTIFADMDIYYGINLSQHESYDHGDSDTLEGNTAFIQFTSSFDGSEGKASFSTIVYNKNQINYNDGLVGTSSMTVVGPGVYPKSFKTLYPEKSSRKTNVAAIVLPIFFGFFFLFFAVFFFTNREKFSNRQQCCCCDQNGCCCCDQNGCCYEQDSPVQPQEVSQTPIQPAESQQKEYKPEVPQPMMYQPGMQQPMPYQQGMQQPMLYQQGMQQPMAYQQGVPQPMMYQPGVPQPMIYQPTVPQPMAYSEKDYENQAKDANNMMYAQQESGMKNPYA
jgi:hypothetical protein